MRPQKSLLLLAIGSFLLGSLLSSFLPVFCRMSFWEEWGTGDDGQFFSNGGYECVRDTFYHSFNAQSTAVSISLNVGILLLCGAVSFGVFRLIRRWRRR